MRRDTQGLLNLIAKYTRAKCTVKKKNKKIKRINKKSKKVNLFKKQFGIYCFMKLDTYFVAAFISQYYLAPRKTEDDNQPKVLNESVLEDNHNLCNYPSTIPLMSSK